MKFSLLLLSVSVAGVLTAAWYLARTLRRYEIDAIVARNVKARVQERWQRKRDEAGELPAWPERARAAWGNSDNDAA